MLTWACRVPRWSRVSPIVLLALVGCRGRSESVGPVGTSAAPSATTPNVDLKPVRPLPAVLDGEGMPRSFAPLAKRANPSVATVKARVERQTAAGRRRVVAEGLGTAFVYDAAGFLLTNNHVIEDATEVSVGFFDGSELPATVVGRDKHTDIAVLKVDNGHLTPLTLADSDRLEVGDWVVAIGNRGSRRDQRRRPREREQHRLRDSDQHGQAVAPHAAARR